MPAGTFMMGSPTDEAERENDEGPERTVTFAEPFAVGRYEITFAQWDACAAAGGCKRYKPDDAQWGRGSQPVINVSWEDARGFAAWLTVVTGNPYRLPSEAEWEYSARAGTTTPFWTGITISAAQANYDGKYIYGSGVAGINRQRPVAVDDPVFQTNPFGLFHVHGVYEWMQDCYIDNYDRAPLDGYLSVDSNDCMRRVVRSGSWFSYPSAIRSAYRGWDTSDTRNIYNGFRVARMLTR